MTQNNFTTFIFAFKYTHIPHFTVGFPGTTSNALLLIAFIKDPLRCFRNSGTYLVMTLSVSDLYTCLFDVPFHLRAIIITGLELVFQFLSMTSGIVSLVSIASISIDRFLLVAYSLKHRHLITGKVMVLWLSGIWVSGAALPFGLFYGNEMKIMPAVYCFSISLIILSVVMYAMIYSTLKKHWKNIAQQNSTESRAQELRILKEKKFLKTIVLIASLAFICIVPYTIYFQLKDALNFSKDNLATVIIEEMLQLMFYVNFAVNPFIYVLRLPNYRKTFYLMYCKRRS